MQLHSLFTVLLALVLCCRFAPGAQAAAVDNLRTSISPARVRIVLDSKAPIDYNYGKEGTKLIVELPHSAAKKQQANLKSELIKSVKLSPVGKTAGRLEIVLKKECQYRIYQLKNPDRLVLDLFRINIIKNTESLGNGVSYTYMQDELSGQQFQAYLVTVAPGSRYELRPFSAAGTFNGRAKLSEQAKQRNMLAAINASYFDTDGWVIGNVKDKGRLMAIDSQPRSGYVTVGNTRQIIKDIAYRGVVVLPSGTQLPIKGMNRQRIANDLVLYNSYYAASTKTNMYGREIKVKNNKVVAVATAGNMKLESDCEVISGHGNMAQALAGIKVGDTVQIVHSYGSQLADAAEMLVSGGPLLLEGGRVNVRTAEENIAKDIAKGRAPRTALGLKKDGSLLLLVVDGRNMHSAGLTLTELAQYFLRLGAVDAVNLDGGGSSEMVIKGKIMNRPSDGKERSVSMGLGLFAK